MTDDGHTIDVGPVKIAAGSAPVGRPDRSGRAREQAETGNHPDEPTADPAAPTSETAS